MPEQKDMWQRKDANLEDFIFSHFWFLSTLFCITKFTHKKIKQKIWCSKLRMICLYAGFSKKKEKNVNKDWEIPTDPQLRRCR